MAFSKNFLLELSKSRIINTHLPLKWKLKEKWEKFTSFVLLVVSAQWQ